MKRMMKNIQKIVALLLVFAMAFSMIPATAMAANSKEEVVTSEYEGVPSATVTLSLSRDAEFMVGPATGEVMTFKEITVPYFDLANYGLEEYYFVSESYGDDGDGLPGSNIEPGTAEYAYGKVTLLHLYIYALEVYYCGLDENEAGQGYLYEEGLIGTEVLNISGSVGSSFLVQFWGGDCNLNYYVNYEYPLASDGWGATCDQILLRDGDIVTLGNFSGYNFYGDTYSIFNYIKVGDDVKEVTVNKGDEVTLSLYYAGANMGMTDGTAQNLNIYQPDVYYCSVDSVSADVTEWEIIGTADDNGELVFDTSDLDAGEYLVCVPGQYGVDFSDDICSTPGGIKLIVEESSASEPECDHNWSPATCTTPKTCTKCSTTEGEPLVHSCDKEVVAEKYLASEATCEKAATYYKSCENCGEAGTDIFTFGEAKGHAEVVVKGKAATCTKTGLTDGKKCSVCGEVTVAQKTIKAKGHSYSTKYTVDKKATAKANGSKSKHCTVCDAKTSVKTIYKASGVKLSTASYTYNGKTKSPSVVIKDSKGNKISSSNYTLTKPSGRKKVGKYTYKITFKNEYSGTKSLTLTIKPKSTSIKSLSKAKKAFTVKWKKQSSQTTGYQIMYSTNKSFKEKYTDTKTISKKNTTKTTIKKLKAKKTYYVKVRTYKNVKINGKNVKVYSSWSKVKKIKTK